MLRRSAEVTFCLEKRDRPHERGLCPALRSFVLPGGCRIDAELHLARTICRRAERRVVALSRTAEVPGEAVRYLNRLGDALFVWGRWANHSLGAAEVLWQPNLAASGRGAPGEET